MLQFIITACLLTGPDLPEDLSPYEPFLDTLRALSQSWELLDDKDTTTFVESYNLHGDLIVIRNRYDELKDAPHDADGMRFCDPQVIAEVLRFNRVYRENMVTQQALADTPSQAMRYGDTIVEADRLFHVWDLARDARCIHYTKVARRKALKELREEVGYQAYCEGRLPPPVPVWRFQHE